MSQRMTAAEKMAAALLDARNPRGGFGRGFSTEDMASKESDALAQAVRSAYRIGVSYPSQTWEWLAAPGFEAQVLEYWDGSALTYGVDSRGIVAIEAQMSRDIKGHVCAECGAALDKTGERCDCFMHPTEGMVCIAMRDWSEEDIFRTGERKGVSDIRL